MLIRSSIVATLFVATSAGAAFGQGVIPSLHDGSVHVTRPAPIAHLAPYFDQVIPLGVHPTMIAVFIDPDNARVNLDDALADAGLADEQVQASTVPGWHYVTLSGEALQQGDVQHYVNQLAADGRLNMVSLVYLGETALPEIPTRDLLVSFRPGTTAVDEAAILNAHNAMIIERDAAGMAGLVRARTNATTGDEMLRIAMAVNHHPGVQWAQSDRIFWAERFGGPNDPLFSQQWALDQPNGQHMGALAAWEISMGDPSIVVAVLDSGVQQNHPDINQTTGQGFTGSGTNGGPGNSCDNHGTAVAGCVAAIANNGIGIAGIAPNVTVRAAKIFNEINFFGFCLPFLESQDSWTVAGINWAASSGARVTNSSWGGGSSAAITTAFNNTRNQGVLHFAASGNEGTGTISWPASLASVNAVGALNSNGNRADFSQYGTGLFISAPGEAVLTTDRTGSAGYEGGDYATVNGTSFASPYAAGVAALVLSVDPSLTPSEVESLLAQTAMDKGTPGYDTTYGWGFINAANALEMIAPGGGVCIGDLNGDQAVDVSDMLAVLNAWGACSGCPADLNEDGAVDVTDLMGVLNAWGSCE